MGFGRAAISEYSSGGLGAFVAWCLGEGITVVAAASPFMYFPDYQTNGFFEFDRAIRGLYESMGVEVLGFLGSNLFGRSEFFDTWYHLNSDRARVYSLSLARALAVIPR